MLKLFLKINAAKSVTILDLIAFLHSVCTILVSPIFAGDPVFGSAATSKKLGPKLISCPDDELFHVLADIVTML